VADPTNDADHAQFEAWVPPSMAKKLTTRLSSELFAAAATIVGALAGLIPAIAAVRFKVIDAIRY